MQVPVSERLYENTDCRSAHPVVRIESLTRRAKALATLPDGTEFYLEGPLPGDTLSVESFDRRDGKNYALTWKLLEGASARRRPPCSVAAACGGCALMALDEDGQRTAKLNYVYNALTRVGIKAPDPRWICDGSTYHYRNRIRLAVTSEGRLSFFNPQKASDCLVLKDALHHTLREVHERLKEHERWLQSIAHVEVRAPDLDGNSGVFFTPRDPAAVATFQSSMPDLGPKVMTGCYGQRPRDIPRQRIGLMRHVWSYVPLSSFMQINGRVNEDLVMHVAAGALKRRAKNFADLYAGAGNFTLPLLSIGLAGAAVESDVASVLSMTDAAASQGLDPPDTVATDAIATASHWARRGEQFDLVVADPPRAGLKHGVESVSKMARKYIALCSCSPESMARDARKFREFGFEIQELLVFNMFPQTHHVETLLWLKRA
jgi:23S rRNA (uracil1939-C5)-methyltransferase